MKFEQHRAENAEVRTQKIDQSEIKTKKRDKVGSVFQLLFLHMGFPLLSEPDMAVPESLQYKIERIEERRRQFAVPSETGQPFWATGGSIATATRTRLFSNTAGAEQNRNVVGCSLNLISETSGKTADCGEIRDPSGWNLIILVGLIFLCWVSPMLCSMCVPARSSPTSRRGVRRRTSTQW